MEPVLLGKPSTYKRKISCPRKWLCEVNYKDEEGNRKRKAFSGASAAEASQRGYEFVDEYITNSNCTKILNYTFSEFALFYLNSVSKNSTRESTHATNYKTYKNCISDAFKKKLMKSITTFDIIEELNLLKSKGYSISVQKKVFSFLNSCFMLFSVSTGKLSPMNAMKPPKNVQTEPQELKYFTTVEMEEIRTVAEDLTYSNNIKHGFAIILILFSGMRYGEACSLSWDDINFEKNTISISKNITRTTVDDKGNFDYKMKITNSPKTKSSVRTITMHPYAKEALLNLREKASAHNCNLVISTSKGNPVSSSCLSSTVKKILSKCSFDTKDRSGIHILRHSFACFLYSQKLSSADISVYLGHSSPRVTEEIYIHNQQEVAQNNWSLSGIFSS